MQGFLLVRKPVGISSFKVVSKVRYLTQVKRVGHAGTLDPFASGLLIIAVGREFTRQIDTFQALDKTYRLTMALGLATDTLDPDGQITQHGTTDNLPALSTVIPQFLGVQMQMPPNFSAKKINGQKAYDLARKGKPVDLKPSQVQIFEIKILEELQGYLPMYSLEVKCSKGTYIRSLVADLATALGTCAYTKDLVRTQIGDFLLEQAVNFQDLTREVIEERLIVETR